MSAVLAFVFSPLGRYAVIGLVVLAAIGGIYWKGDRHGAARVQAKWDAAVQRSIERSEAARADAESSVSIDADDRSLLNDPDNRNRH